ncbi:hypothetical protein LPJ53_006369, partial [Coemansia erecta]
MGLFRKSKKEKAKGSGNAEPGETSGPQYGLRRGAVAGAGEAQPAAGGASTASGLPRSDADGGEHPVSAAAGGTTIDQVSQSVIDGFAYGVPYLRLNTSILVACHSEASLSSSLFSEEASMVYSAACYHDVHDVAARDSLDPHVFELVADAYAHMRRLRQDQAVVLSGVSGSGKSETAKLVCDQLCVLASNGGRHSTRAQYQMAYLGAIVEAFASAATAESMGATRVGLWQEVQFNERGRISGAKLAAFGLDRWRVTAPLRAGEANFNVFAYLLHGSSSSERQQWQLRHGDAQAFAYLAQPQHQRAGADPAHAAQMMDQLRTALKVCGVGSRQQAHVLQVLAAILHLGNVRFGDAPDRSEDAAVVRSPEEVDVCAQLLGVSSAALTAALSYKTALVGGDLCTVFLNAHGAHAQRDALARALYHVLFYWLVDQVNRNTSDAEAANHIAVLQ